MRKQIQTAILIVMAGCICSAVGAKEEKWIRVPTSQFTLVTTLSEKEAVAWSAEFDQYIASLRDLFAFQRPLPPLTVVIFARKQAFDEYRPLNAQGKAEAVAGYFLRYESWAIAALAGANESEEVRRTFFHEGVHWFLSAIFDEPNPVWLEEGLAEVFSTFEADRKESKWGRAIPPHVFLLRNEGPIKLERLLYTGRNELFADESSRTSIVYAQSWAFVHFLLFGGNHYVKEGALFKYVRLMQAGKFTDEAFREAFGSDFAAMDRELAAYLQRGSYFIGRKPIVALPALTAEAASPAEVQQALGRLAVVAHRRDKAMAHARAVIAAAPESPQGYELLGIACKESGDAAGALPAFTAAIEKGTRDFQPYFELGVNAQQAAAGTDGETGSLAPAEARRIANYYERAINLYPRFLPSYQNLAGVIGRAEPWSENDRGFLEAGHKFYPKDGAIWIGLATLSDRAGDRVEARKILQLLLNDSTQPARVRRHAGNLDDAWDQQETLKQLEALNKAQKFAEALALIETQVEGSISTRWRSQLVAMRPPLRVAVRSREIEQALNEQRWADARRLMQETINTPEMPASLRKMAERVLADLERRKLGGGKPKD